MIGRPRWYGLALQVLHLAIHGDRDGSSAMLAQLVDKYGPGVVPEAMCAWADAVLAYIPALRPGQAVEMEMFAAAGTRTDPHDAPSPSVWACRMIAARAAYDRDMWNGLIAAAPDDPYRYGAYVLVLIETCALNVRELRRAGARPIHTWPARRAAG